MKTLLAETKFPQDLRSLKDLREFYFPQVTMALQILFSMLTQFH